MWKTIFNANYVMALQQQRTHFSLSLVHSFSSFLSTFSFNDDAFSTFYLETATFNFLLRLPALRRRKSKKSCTHLLNRDFLKAKRRTSTCMIIFYGAWWHEYHATTASFHVFLKDTNCSLLGRAKKLQTQNSLFIVLTLKPQKNYPRFQPSKIKQFKRKKIYSQL